MTDLFKSLINKVGLAKKPGGNGHKRLPEDLHDHLRKEFRLTGEDMASFCCVCQQGKFAGLPVRYVRIFDHNSASKLGTTVAKYTDLDKKPELVLFDGHIFKSGAVCLNKKKDLEKHMEPPTQS